jgi:exodeoxyribonuclease V alpha subunit
MKSPAASQTQEVPTGLVERVTYHNPENGFYLLRAKARGHRDLVTIVAQWITATGDGSDDRTHGQQFKTVSAGRTTDIQ